VGKNVLVPRPALERLVALLDCPEVARLPNALDLSDILRELKLKLKKLETRESYEKLISTDDPDLRTLARCEYLWQKRQLQLGNVEFGEAPF